MSDRLQGVHSKAKQAWLKPTSEKDKPIGIVLWAGIEFVLGLLYPKAAGLASWLSEVIKVFLEPWRLRYRALCLTHSASGNEKPLFCTSVAPKVHGTCLPTRLIKAL